MVDSEQFIALLAEPGRPAGPAHGTQSSPNGLFHSNLGAGTVRTDATSLAGQLLLGGIVPAPCSILSRTLRAIVALVLPCAALTCTIRPAHAETSVSGAISEDTTWTAVGSPYRLTGPVAIPAGVTLRIEPGVTVVADAAVTFPAGSLPGAPWFSVLGTLDLDGTEQDPVRVEGQTSRYRPLVGGAIDSSVPRSGMVLIDHAELTIANLTPRDAAANLESWTMTDSEWRPGDTGVRFEGIGQTTWTRNAIVGGGSSGSIFRFLSNTTLIGNRFRAVQVSCDGGSMTLRHNTLEKFHSNWFPSTSRGSAVRAPSCAVDARLNYWEQSASLADRVFDSSDQLDYKAVDVRDPLADPAAGTPTLEPAFIDSHLQVAAYSTGLTAWWAGDSSDGGLPMTRKAEAIPAGGDGTPEQIKQDTLSTAVFRNLDTSKSYFVRVTYANAKGTVTVISASATTPLETATPPGPPPNLLVQRAARAASFSWGVAPDGGAPIHYYQWVLKNDQGDVVEASGGPGASTTVNGLTGGSRYSFEVYAANDMGSGQVSATSFTAADTPDAPAAASATRSNKAAAVRWTTAANRGSTVTSYRVTAAPGGASIRVAGTVRSARVTGLRNGTRYSFHVRALNAYGWGPIRRSGSIVPAGKPLAPSRATARSGRRQAIIRWTAAPANGAAIRRYRIAGFGRTLTVGRGSRSATIRGLARGKRYRFMVRAVNDVGIGAGRWTAAVRPK